MRHLGLGDRVQVELRELAKRVGETVNFGVVRRRRVIYLYSIESKETLRTAIKVGSTLPAHATAIGKVILASASPSTIDAYMEQTPLEPFTPNSITSPTEFKARLEQIQEDGYTIDMEECHIGVRAVGAPVRGPNGRVIAAVAVTGPAARMDETKIQETTHETVAAANSVSRLLGHFDDEVLEIDRLTEAILL